MEGVDIQGREVNFEAPQGEINIEAEREITIDGEVRGEIVVLESKINFKKILQISLDMRALPRGGLGYAGEEPQYKMCVCMPSGMVYRIKMQAPLTPPGAAGPERKPGSTK